MSRKGYSRRGLFGEIYHYDENGNRCGTSRPGFFGSYTNYDESGRMTGHSRPGLFGGYTHYDKSGKSTGHSSPGIFGGYTHYDSNHKPTGHSSPGLFDSYNHSSSGGCYIATCVYGSYDCPEVWTLRRFRDDTLASTALGRGFIRTYYAISPKLVKRFGGTSWFKKFWRKRLDKIVLSLNLKGVEATPYDDDNINIINK